MFQQRVGPPLQSGRVASRSAGGSFSGDTWDGLPEPSTGTQPWKVSSEVRRPGHGSSWPRSPDVRTSL